MHILRSLSTRILRRLSTAIYKVLRGRVHIHIIFESFLDTFSIGSRARIKITQLFLMAAK